MAKYAADTAKEITVAYCGQKGLYLTKEDGKNAGEFYSELYNRIYASLSISALAD